MEIKYETGVTDWVESQTINISRATGMRTETPGSGGEVTGQEAGGGYSQGARRFTLRVFFILMLIGP